jgi:hypothetical protein
MNAARACRDSRERHVTRRHWEIPGVVLADPEEAHTHGLGVDASLDHAADGFGLRARLAVFVVDQVAEGVDAEHEGRVHALSGSRAHCARPLTSARTTSSEITTRVSCIERAACRIESRRDRLAGVDRTEVG